eukprot:TRINITY_DN7349_c0_g1_i1.p1 TRINITY_DN7349_c0_g1~~TRINITY_DN7349_c0_g1_i1.p1  ORF type:complete len:233 (+),score=38.98 TRINITY_DN7349_c0_g1_i1:75-773(+)
MTSNQDYYEDPDEVLETINVGGSCAATRLLQVRLFGLQVVCDAVRGKIRRVAREDRDAAEQYRLKEKCVDWVGEDWYVVLHMFRKIKGPAGHEPDTGLHRSLVFCDASNRCWLVVICDPNLELESVPSARTAASSLHSILAALEFPISDISYLVYAPCSTSLPPQSGRGRLDLTDPPPLTPLESALLTELKNCEAGQKALRDIKKQHKTRQGCDPPPGSTLHEGRTIVPNRQ